MSRYFREIEDCLINFKILIKFSLDLFKNLNRLPVSPSVCTWIKFAYSFLQNYVDKHLNYLTVRLNY